MNYNGAPVTTSEIQPYDQVITSAATSKSARPNRPPPTPPTGLTKATSEQMNCQTQAVAKFRKRPQTQLITNYLSLSQ